MLAAFFEIAKKELTFWINNLCYNELLFSGGIEVRKWRLKMKEEK